MICYLPHKTLSSVYVEIPAQAGSFLLTYSWPVYIVSHLLLLACWDRLQHPWILLIMKSIMEGWFCENSIHANIFVKHFYLKVLHSLQVNMSVTVQFIFSEWTAGEGEHSALLLFNQTLPPSSNRLHHHHPTGIHWSPFSSETSFASSEPLTWCTEGDTPLMTCLWWSVDSCNTTGSSHQLSPVPWQKNSSLDHLLLSHNPPLFQRSSTV